MIAVRSALDKDGHRALTKRWREGCLASLVVGALGLVSYIAISAFVEAEALDVMLVFAAPFAIGLVGLISMNRTIKKTAESGYLNEYVFDEREMKVFSVQNGEVTAMQKVPYEKLYKVRETNEYLFFYLNRASAFIVKKENCSAEEIEGIKRLVGDKLKK